MEIHLSTGDGVPLYLQIVNQVKYLAATGRLSSGDQMPPVRKLAEQLVVNPNTVARAYRELETAGVLSARRGSGVFVSDHNSPLARKEKHRIIKSRIEQLLTEARHLDVDVETVVKLLRQENRRIR